MTDEALETAADPAQSARRRLTAARPALDRAYRLAGLLLDSGTEAEDAVQDALVLASQRFDDLREASRCRRQPGRR